MNVKASNISHDSGQDVTRRLLLEAAGEVFAEAGFRDATIREICQRAGANVAAINYHFGDKARLYLEVLRYARSKGLEKYPMLLGVAATAPAEEKLQAYVLSMLSRIFDKGPTSWHGRLMLREMIEPTVALDALIEERVRPMAEVLWEIIGELMQRPPTDEQVIFCGFSVVSQCVFYNHCQPAIDRLCPRLTPKDPDGVARLSAHITQFSLAAIRSLAAEKT